MWLENIPSLSAPRLLTSGEKAFWLELEAARTNLAVLDREPGKPACSAPFSPVPAIFSSLDFRYSFAGGVLK